MRLQQFRITVIIFCIGFLIYWIGHQLNMFNVVGKEIRESENKKDAVVHKTPLPHYGIIKQVTDERGLTSVIYRDSAGEWALDYLTQIELDSLKQTFK